VTMTKLTGRVGLLTGTATGIGRAGAALFAREGAALVTLDSNEEEGRRTVAGIEQAGGRAVFVHGDVSRPDDVQRAVTTAVDTYGKLDLVWSNAGVGVFKTVPETSVDEWDFIVGVNLKGAFLVGKYAIPELIRAGGGTVVITGSVNSFAADRQWAAYCATKGGVLMLARAMALDHAPEHVRVNCVCPGSVDTALQERWLRARSNLAYADAVAADQAAHPLGRYATPEEVARAALFLSCDDSAFTTGSAVMVDGGLTAQ
jgi:NAD(P)-dependent dehydrogenase (short-subunit alcohol dehydrogenase family)